MRRTIARVRKDAIGVWTWTMSGVGLVQDLRDRSPAPDEATDVEDRARQRERDGRHRRRPPGPDRHGRRTPRRRPASRANATPPHTAAGSARSCSRRSRRTGSSACGLRVTGICSFGAGMGDLLSNRWPVAWYRPRGDSPTIATDEPGSSGCSGAGPTDHRELHRCTAHSRGPGPSTTTSAAR